MFDYDDRELESCIESLDVREKQPSSAGLSSSYMFRGSTPNLRYLGCHVSLLAPGKTPHEPHSHPEEEILLLLEGSATLILSDGRRRMAPGDFVYYPAGLSHTIEAAAEQSAKYMMLRWRSNRVTQPGQLEFRAFSFGGSNDHDAPAVDGFSMRRVFEGPTQYLRNLHCHTSCMEPGSGYRAHVDAHDVAIVLFDGEVETQGQVVGPGSIMFYPAGERHGMRNCGHETARYLVFEFHGTRRSPARALRYASHLVMERVSDRKWWQRQARKAVRRARALFQRGFSWSR